jgi:hypothetical protein
MDSQSSKTHWPSFNRGKEHGMRLAKEQADRAYQDGWINAIQFLLVAVTAVAVLFMVIDH